MSVSASMAAQAESYGDLLRSGPHWLFELTLEVVSAPIVFLAGWVWRNRLLGHVHRDLSLLRPSQPRVDQRSGLTAAECPGEAARRSSGLVSRGLRVRGEAGPPMPRSPRTPVSLFGLPFGLAGLAGTWSYAGKASLAPTAVGNALMATAGITWLVVIGLYLRGLMRQPRVLREDLGSATNAPFTALALLTPMLFVAGLADPGTPDAIRVVFDALVALTVVLAAWTTSAWVVGPVPLGRIHPGYLLPSVAGGYIASLGASSLGQVVLAQAMFGLGSASWIVVGPLLTLRLVTAPALPVSLTPTLAIQVAPAAVGSLAWFSLNGGRLDPTAAALAGYGLLTALAQLRLLPLYRRLPTSPALWALAFPSTALATAALHWVRRPGLTGTRPLAYVVLAAATFLVAFIATRTIGALMKGELLSPLGTGDSVPVEVAAYARQGHSSH